MRAVWLCFGSLALTVAPNSMSWRTASALPLFAQVMRGVSPVAMAVLGLAPFLRRRRTRGAPALVQASESGVMPKSLVALGSAPLWSRRSAGSGSFQWASQRRAVEPSPERALTSGFCARRVRRVWASLFLAASTREGPERLEVAARPTTPVRTIRVKARMNMPRPLYEISVRRGALDAVDKQDVDRRAAGFVLQAELFLDGGEERSAGFGILFRRVFQVDVEGAVDAGTVEDGPLQFVGEDAGEQFGGDSF